MSEYKRFWIENGSFVYNCQDKEEFLNGWKAGGKGPWEVIEIQAYNDLKAKLDECESLLYKAKNFLVLKNDPMNLCYRIIEYFRGEK